MFSPESIQSIGTMAKHPDDLAEMLTITGAYQALLDRDLPDKAVSQWGVNSVLFCIERDYSPEEFEALSWEVDMILGKFDHPETLIGVTHASQEEN